MLIECLIRREGPTVIELAKTKYTFTPVPGSKKGEMTTSVCDVSSEEHVLYLLDERRGGQFREYDPKQSALDSEKIRAQASNYIGFNVEKFQDSGYIVIDKRDKQKPKYAGIEGRWVDDRKGLTAFPTEFQAFEFLKEEVEGGGIEGTEPEPEPQKRGPGNPAWKKQKADSVI